MTDRAARRVPATVAVAALVVLALVVALVVGLVRDEDADARGARPTGADVGAERRDDDERAASGRRATLGIGTGWGPSRRDVRRAARAARSMSLPELAGQVIVADYNGTAAPTGLVEDLHLGGVIIFDRNVSSSGALRTEMRSLERAVDRPWPLWVSADQEGGLVERLQDDLTRFPAFMSAGATSRDRLVRAAARGSGRELAWLGLTADFAPVADVTAGPADPTIGSRSASEFTRRAAEAVTAASQGFLDAGVVPVLKHFPGHGAAPADSHLTLPVLDRPLQGLRKIDLRPFRRGVAAGLPAVMVGHLDVRAVDPGRPSSLSREVVTGLLRERLGFEGLVVSDALDMGAITSRAGSAASAVAALRAGVDLLVMPPDPRAARDGIVAAVRAGDLPLRTLRRAATRQGALMLHQAGERRGDAVRRPWRPGKARSASWALSRGAVTQVAGTCGVRHVGGAISITGPADDAATLAAAARTAGLAVVEPSSAGAGSATRVAVTGFRGGPVSGDVVVASDTPWSLGASSAPVKIAAFGDTAGAMRAVVQVLLGRRAPGRLPVRVPGVTAGC